MTKKWQGYNQTVEVANREAVMTRLLRFIAASHYSGQTSSRHTAPVLRKSDFSGHQARFTFMTDKFHLNDGNHTQRQALGRWWSIGFVTLHVFYSIVGGARRINLPVFEL